MCKKTTRRAPVATREQVRQGPVNTVSPTVPTPGGGSTPTPPVGPDLEAGTTAPIFGEPDFAPQVTFIAQASGTDNGFIALANAFHTNSGLNPITVQSIEQIVDFLNDPSRTGSGPINRIRIVTHVFFDPSPTVNPTNMMLPFLTGGVRPTLKRHFEGFAGTSLEALKSMMSFETTSFTTTTIFVYADRAADVMNLVRAAHTATINLVPVDSLGDPSGDFADFFMASASKCALNRNAVPDATASTALNRAYDLLLVDIITRIRSTIPEPQLIAVRDAIINLGTSASLNFIAPNNPASYGTNLSLALTAIQGDAFRTKLARMRQRIDQNSKVDIRGCQVGRDPDYLRAIQLFFGTDTTRRPSVSGPEWFQHFNEIGFTSAQNPAHIPIIFNTGIAPYSATRIRQFFDSWATGFGITDAHVSFWVTTMGLNAVEFASLQWRTNIPTAAITVLRLQTLSTGDISAVVPRLVSIFLITTNIPNPTQLSVINVLSSSLQTWTGHLNATIADSAATTELTAFFNNLKTVYENVDNRFTATASPSAAQRVVPAAEPTGVTAANLRTMQTALKNFIDTHANSKFRPIKNFMGSCLTNLQDPPAKFRYYLGLGMPFLVYDPAATNSNRNFLVAYEDQTGPSLREDDAVKYWIRSQWSGLIPNNLGAAATWNNSRHTPWLVEHRQPPAGLTIPPFVLSPTPEYHAKIVTVNH